VTSKAGFEPALPGAKYPKSSPPAFVEPQDDLRQTENHLSRRMVRAASCEPSRVRSAIGVRLIASFPPAGPARLGTRVIRASPGIRVSRSGFRRAFPNKLRSGQQKTLRSAWLGRVRGCGLFDLASGKIAPMSRACAIDRHHAVRKPR
jgi:hypothetical protein